MIRKRSRFLEIGKNGQSFYSRFFILLEDSGEGLLGITVTKKVGNAVNRNKLRRRVKEILRHDLGLLSGDKDRVLIVKRGANRPAFLELKNDLISLMVKSKGASL